MHRRLQLLGCKKQRSNEDNDQHGVEHEHMLDMQSSTQILLFAQLVMSRHHVEANIPDADFVSSNLICNSLHNLQAQAAPVLNAATILISTVVGCRLDELVNDVALLQPATRESRRGIKHGHSICCFCLSASGSSSIMGSPHHMRCKLHRLVCQRHMHYLTNYTQDAADSLACTCKLLR